MRLFVAIPLPDEMKTSLVGLMHALKKAGVKGNYVPVQNLHLTLAFIGGGEGCAQDGFLQAVPAVSHGAGELLGSSLGWRKGKPGIVCRGKGGERCAGFSRN